MHAVTPAAFPAKGLNFEFLYVTYVTMLPNASNNSKPLRRLAGSMDGMHACRQANGVATIIGASSLHAKALRASLSFRALAGRQAGCYPLP